MLGKILIYNDLAEKNCDICFKKSNVRKLLLAKQNR